MRGRSANNPIIVEDEDDRPSIGRKPLQTQHVTSGCLPVPSSEEILSNLVKQKNLIPVMDALVRLVAGSAVPLPSGSASNAQNAPPTASSSSTHVQPYHPYPYYPYPYAYPYYYSYPYGYTYPYAASAFQRSPAPSTSYAPPPPKKRRLNDVPAGASEWDVPYPFPEGQGPPDYHQNWQRQRGQQLVEDLVGLVKSAAKKAAVQKAQGEASAKDGPVIGSVEYYRERVLRNFRHPRYDILPTPHTATSSATPEREAIKSSPTSSSASAEDGSDIVVLDDPRAPAQSSPAKAATSPKPVFVAPMASLTDTTTATHSEESINKSQGDSMPMPPSPVTADLITNKVVNVASDNVDDCLPHHTQNNIDDLLSIFDDLPVGDLDALLNSTDFSSINPGNFDFSAFDMTGVMDVSESLAARDQSAESTPGASTSDTDDLRFDFDLDALQADVSFAIDPELLALPHPGPPPGATSAPEGELRPERPSLQTSNMPSATGSGAPPTPTLVGSPLSQADFDPPTPEWNLQFPEPEIADAGTEGAPPPRGGHAGASTVPKDLRRYVLIKGIERIDGPSGGCSRWTTLRTPVSQSTTSPVSVLVS